MSILKLTVPPVDADIGGEALDARVTGATDIPLNGWVTRFSVLAFDRIASGRARIGTRGKGPGTIHGKRIAGQILGPIGPTFTVAAKIVLAAKVLPGVRVAVLLPAL